MPGRSVTCASAWPRMRPSLRSTVTPGKLPTCWLDPVSWLNSVVLPQFWLPTSANVTGSPSGSGCSSALSWNRPPSPRPGCGSGFCSSKRRRMRVPPRPSATARSSSTSIRRASSRRSVQLVAMDAHLHGVAHGRVLHHGDVDLRDDAHVQEVLAQRSLAADRDHRGRVPEGKVVQRAHVLVSSRRRRSPLADTVSHRLLSRTIVALLDGDGTKKFSLANGLRECRTGRTRIPAAGDRQVRARADACPGAPRPIRRTRRQPPGRPKPGPRPRAAPPPPRTRGTAPG